MKRHTPVSSLAVDPTVPLLKIQEVAALLRVSVSCVRTWVSTKKISFVRLGGKNLLFRRTDVDGFIAKHTTVARGAA